MSSFINLQDLKSSKYILIPKSNFLQIQKTLFPTVFLNNYKSPLTFVCVCVVELNRKSTFAEFFNNKPRII